MTRSRDLADQQKNLGGPVPPTVAAKNVVVNGAMDFWQRSTSITGGNENTYTADRWVGCRAGAVAGMTISRQTTSDTTNLPFIQYCTRVQRTAANTSTAILYLNQSFESVNSIPLAGKSVVLSYYARAGANYSAASSVLVGVIQTGTGTDQNALAGYTGSAFTSGNATLTTTWQRFTVSHTIPATATEVSVNFQFTPVGTAGANDYFEVTGVQLEIGSTATPFSRAGGTIQGELAACQRYYQKSYAQGTAVPTNAQFIGTVVGPSITTTNNACFGYVKFATPMRTAPTVTNYSYTSSTAAALSNAAGTDQGASSAVASGIGDSGYGIYNNSGGTITTTNGWIVHFAASAEL